MTDDPYVYPGTTVLKNSFGATDREDAAFLERRASAQRAREVVPGGAFDLEHLKAIHKHLFQDVYEWAGEVRTVEISKADQQFQFRRFFDTGMRDVVKRLESSNYLRGLAPREFAKEAGRIMGDVNYIHPFREGNTGTQLQYLKQLAEQAGQKIDLAKIPHQEWVLAARESNDGRYEQLAGCIAGSLEPRLSRAIRSRDRGEREDRGRER